MAIIPPGGYTPRPRTDPENPKWNTPLGSLSQKRKMPPVASPNASEKGQLMSRTNGKKKGILKQAIKPALNGNKFRGTIKPKTRFPGVNI